VALAVITTGGYLNRSSHAEQQQPAVLKLFSNGLACRRSAWNAITSSFQTEIDRKNS